MNIEKMKILSVKISSLSLCISINYFGLSVFFLLFCLCIEILISQSLFHHVDFCF
jgi:hypothetical protein